MNKITKIFLFYSTSTFFNEVSDDLSIIIDHLQDIAEPIQNNLHNLGVLHHEQVAEWRDHLLLNQVFHLQTKTFENIKT